MVHRKPPETSVVSKPVVIGTSARGIIEVVEEEPPPEAA
jgi:hypothetical protein